MRNRIRRWRKVRELRRKIENEYVHIAEAQAQMERNREAESPIEQAFVGFRNYPLVAAERHAWRRISAHRAELGALGDGRHRRAR